MLTRKERKRLKKGLSIAKKEKVQLPEKVLKEYPIQKQPAIDLNVNNVYLVEKALLLDTISAFRHNQYAKGFTQAKNDMSVGLRKHLILDQCHSDSDMVSIITKLQIDSTIAITIAGIMTCFCDRVFAQGYMAFLPNRDVVLPTKKLI